MALAGAYAGEGTRGGSSRRRRLLDARARRTATSVEHARGVASRRQRGGVARWRGAGRGGSGRVFSQTSAWQPRLPRQRRGNAPSAERQSPCVLGEFARRWRAGGKRYVTSDTCSGGVLKEQSPSDAERHRRRRRRTRRSGGAGREVSRGASSPAGAFLGDFSGGSASGARRWRAPTCVCCASPEAMTTGAGGCGALRSCAAEHGR